MNIEFSMKKSKLQIDANAIQITFMNL